MKTQNSSEKINVCRHIRTLKIEAVGDFWKGGIKPKIRLTGHWLARAGFSPGHHVQIKCASHGILELRFCERGAAGTEQSEGPECPF